MLMTLRRAYHKLRLTRHFSIPQPIITRQTHRHLPKECTTQDCARCLRRVLERSIEGGARQSWSGSDDVVVNEKDVGGYLVSCEPDARMLTLLILASNPAVKTM